MLTFPDPNVETEYTDPNGSVWAFNGTGWVRQSDCDSSGGGGGELPPTEAAKVPRGIQFIGSGYSGGSRGSSSLASPLCFGNEIYVSSWNTGFSQMQWYRSVLGEDGSVTQDGSGYSPLPSGITYNTVCNPCPWNVRLGNYVFQSKKGAQVFVKKNADNSISFINLEDIGVNAWWGKAVSAQGCFEGSDGESVIMVFTEGGGTGGMFAKVGLDENGDLTLIGQSSAFSANSTHGNVAAVFVTETSYGYFYGHVGNSGQQCGYNFASVRDDFGTLQNLQKNNITHHPSSAPQPSQAVGARYNNGRGHAIIMPLGNMYTAVIGPVVDENGFMYGQQWEANSSYWNSSLVGSQGTIAVNNSLTGQIGSSSVGSTCGAYCKPSHRFKNQTASVSLPAVVMSDAYLINTSGDRWHNVAVNSTSFVPVPAVADGQPVVRAADDFWVSLGQSGDSNLYLFKDTELVTRGALKDVVSAKAEKIKKEIESQNSKSEEEEKE